MPFVITYAGKDVPVIASNATNYRLNDGVLELFNEPHKVIISANWDHVQQITEVTKEEAERLEEELY